MMGESRPVGQRKTHSTIVDTRLTLVTLNIVELVVLVPLVKRWNRNGLRHKLERLVLAGFDGDSGGHRVLA